MVHVQARVLVRKDNPDSSPGELLKEQLGFRGGYSMTGVMVEMGKIFKVMQRGPLLVTYYTR